MKKYGTFTIRGTLSQRQRYHAGEDVHRTYGGERLRREPCQWTVSYPSSGFPSPSGSGDSLASIARQIQRSWEPSSSKAGRSHQVSKRQGTEQQQHLDRQDVTLAQWHHRRVTAAASQGRANRGHRFSITIRK
jgi:hypothetical protein